MPRASAEASSRVSPPAGARVLIADLQLQPAQALARELQGKSCEAQALGIDLADEVAIAALLGGLERLDILVHNAGYFPLTPFAEITPAILQRTLAVNLSALFWLTQGALPLFERQGKGCVLVTSSVTGPRVAYPGLSHFAASKAGVNGFIRSAALELAASKVRVNGVEPGMIRPPAMGNLGDGATAPTSPVACLWAVSASPRISPGPCSFSPRTRPAISPARPSSSTAAQRCRKPRRRWTEPPRLRRFPWLPVAPAGKWL